MVERIFRNFDGDVFSPYLGLTAYARSRLQAPGTVKKVFFQLVSFFQRVETLANNAVASGASADTAAGTLDLDVVLVGNFEDGLAGLSLHDHTVRAMLGVWQKNDLRHQLFLNFIQVAARQGGFYRLVHAAGGEGIGHLRQALGLLLDGIAIGAFHQFGQFLHLQVDDHALFSIQQAFAVDLQCALHRFEQAPGIDLLLTQYAGDLVVTGILERILEHLGDFAIGQTVGRLDLDTGFNARAQFTRSHAEQAIGVDLEGHANFRRTRDHRRDTAQFKACQGAAVADQLTLALQHMNHHGRLAIFVSGEVLGASDGDGGVAWNHLLHQATHGFQTQGQRNHVEQQQFATVALVACQGIGLDRGTNGHHLIRIDFSQRLAAKRFGNRFADARHTGRTTDHHHGSNIFQLNAGITHGATASLEAAGDHRFDQRIKGFTGQLGRPIAVGNFNRGRVSQGFFGDTGSLQQMALLARVQVSGQTGTVDDPTGDRVVEVIAAQGRITTGGQHLKDTASQAQD